MECQKCRNLLPLLTYFLSKEENAKLTKDDRRLCYNCYLKRYPKRHPKALRDLRKVEMEYWQSK